MYDLWVGTMTIGPVFWLLKELILSSASWFTSTFSYICRHTLRKNQPKTLTIGILISENILSIIC